MSDISTFIRNAQKRISTAQSQVGEQFSSAKARVADSKVGAQLSSAQTRVAGAVPASLRGGQLKRTQKMQLAGIGVCSVAVLTCGIAIPATSGGSTSTDQPVAAAQSVTGDKQVKELHTSVTNQMAHADQQAKAAKAKLQAAQEAQAKAEAQKNADARSKATATKDRADEQAASRNAARTPAYTNNLDGWIRESLDIMKAKGIPGSYEGLHRNIIRESSGNTKAINLWDINARNGVPSKGLLQMIQPTFDRYHVSGTPDDIWNPVSNITAAANYAADRYGTMDNVDSAY